MMDGFNTTIVRNVGSGTSTQTAYFRQCVLSAMRTWKEMIEKMKADEYMEHIRQLKRRIELIEQELKAIDDEMITMPGINYDPNRVASAPRQDKLEMQVIRLIEIKEELTEELLENKQRYILDVHEAMGYIRQIKSEHQQDVLILRYINNMKWEDVLIERGYDNRSSQDELKNRALISLQEILDRDS